MKAPTLTARFCVLATAAYFCSACVDEGPRPAGQPNPSMVQLAADGWVSQDTVVSIDPLTGEETVRAYVTDMSPDTLASGEVVYQAAEYMPVLESCAAADDPLFCTQTTLATFTTDNLRYPRPALVPRGWRLGHRHLRHLGRGQGHAHGHRAEPWRRPRRGDAPSRRGATAVAPGLPRRTPRGRALPTPHHLRGAAGRVAAKKFSSAPGARAAFAKTQDRHVGMDCRRPGGEPNKVRTRSP